MLRSIKFVSLLLAMAAMLALITGCGSANRCVKMDGETVSVPSIKLSYSFPEPWFKVTEDELAKILGDLTQLTNYIDEDGNLLVEPTEGYTGQELVLLNGKTLEICRFFITEETTAINLEDFIFQRFDELEPEMAEISLPRVCTLGEHPAFCLTTVPKDSTQQISYFYTQANSTFVEIVTNSYSGYTQVDDVIATWEAAERE